MSRITTNVHIVLPDKDVGVEISQKENRIIIFYPGDARDGGDTRFVISFEDKVRMIRFLDLLHDRIKVIYSLIKR